MKLTTLLTCIFLGFFPLICHASRVLELTDRFPEFRRSGDMWMVKFYTPWCGHCVKVEPIWIQVGQSLSRTNIRVGRMDISKYPSMGTAFKASATPTIKFLKGDFEHTYTGERTVEALTHYALRMASPAVQDVPDQSDRLKELKEKNQLFFAYIGEKTGPLWESYLGAAQYLQPFVYFYWASEASASHLNLTKVPTILVHKEGDHYFYEEDFDTNISDIAHVNATLLKWINRERFPAFLQITSETLPEIMATEKFIVMVIVDENKVKKIPEDMLKFRDRVESVIRKKRDLYHNHFQFGWMGNSDLADSLMRQRVPLPYLLVLNSTTFHHHVPDIDPALMTVEAIEGFLHTILNETSPVYGGNSLHVRVARRVFDTKRILENMWRGNPVLLIVVITFPCMFFIMIIWTCCCADILDADEDDEEEDYHEKLE